MYAALKTNIVKVVNTHTREYLLDTQGRTYRKLQRKQAKQREEAGGFVRATPLEAAVIWV